MAKKKFMKREAAEKKLSKEAPPKVRSEKEKRNALYGKDA